MHVVELATMSVARTAILVFILGALPSIAHAQPGQPVVQIGADFTATVSYSARTPAPPPGAFLAATYNGASMPGSPFFIGSLTTVATAPLAPGTYTVRVLWGTTESPTTSFTISADLGAPMLRAAGVDLTTVTLAWDPAPGAVAGYEVEATLASTGEVFTIPLGNVTTVTTRDVMPGQYTVRVRARNSFGPGPYSNPIDVQVGSVLALGDLQVTLTWNTQADMDLHVLEPNGAHVFYDNPEGPSARLDFDDTDGFGPETAFVAAGRAFHGVYLIGIVQGTQEIETTSTISITLGAGTPDARTAIITRRTKSASPDTAVLVAQVNVLTGEVVEWTGTTPIQ